ncbi:hypothetical protein [Anaerofustis butyriciformans]|uniref:hypothetical protein n=1 Tax=Anaerofustis butyriciformans TaxID=3108533 RepID=UPI003F89C03A
MRNKYIDEILKKSAGTISNSIKTINKESIEKARRNNNGNVNNKAYKSANNVVGALRSGVKSAFNNKNFSNGSSGSSINTKDYANSDLKNGGLNKGSTQFKDNNIKPFNQMGFENYYNIQKQKEQKEQKQKEAINKSVADIYKQSYNYINKGLQNSAKILKQKSAPIYSKSGLKGNTYNSTNNDKKVNTDSIVYKGDNNLKSKVYTQNSNVNKDFMTYHNTYTQNKKLGMDFINQNNNKTYITSYDPKTIREPEEKKNQELQNLILKNSGLNMGGKKDLHSLKNPTLRTHMSFDEFQSRNKNKQKADYSSVINNAKPMNSTKTYAEINSAPRRPGDLSKEFSTDIYNEKVFEPYIQKKRVEEEIQKQNRENLYDNFDKVVQSAKGAPRYGDFSKKQYYGEVGGAIDDYISRKVSEETKELLKEDYGDPGAVNIMLIDKGAENLDFSNSEALKKNPILKDVDISLMQSMTEEERKMLYVAMSDHMAEDKTGYNDVMRAKIPYAMALVVSDRIEQDTLDDIATYGNDYLIKITIEESLYRNFEGGFQTGRVMGTNFNPFYKRGQSAALERLKHEGTEEQKMIIYGFEGVADTITDSCIDAGNKPFPLIGKFEAYNIAWGKSYSHSLNYDYYDLDISIKEAQDKAFYDANKSLALGMMPDVADAWVKYNISDNLLTYLNQIDYMDMKTIFKQYGIDIGKDTLWSTVVNANNKINEYMANEEKDNKK